MITIDADHNSKNIGVQRYIIIYKSSIIFHHFHYYQRVFGKYELAGTALMN